MSGKAKIKQFKKTIGDVNINGMFEEMMGLKDADQEIVIPKFVFVRNGLRQIYRVLNQFCNILEPDFPTHSAGFIEIRKFATDMKESAYLRHDQDETEDLYKSLTKEEINGLYRKLKDNTYVRTLILVCSKLKRYESNFTDQDNLKENFVNQEPGLTFRIFEFSNLDLKALWANDKIKSSVKRYVLMVLANIYKHTHSIYKCTTSPDVDVEKFTQLLITAIGELKKQPKLHRCHNAFRRIEQSVHLLRDKFDDYYRDSIISENANMLVMNFIVDVSNQGGATATLTREFRTIIKYMHEVSNKTGKNKDPNVQKIFKMLNSNFSIMEKNTTSTNPVILPTDEIKIQDDSNAEIKIQDDPNAEIKIQDDPLDVTNFIDELSDLKDEPTFEEPINIAEEKQAKRIKKQKAKKKKKAKKNSSDSISVNVDLTLKTT